MDAVFIISDDYMKQNNKKNEGKKVPKKKEKTATKNVLEVHQRMKVITAMCPLKRSIAPLRNCM